MSQRKLVKRMMSVAGFAVALFTNSVHGIEVTVKNDSFVSGGSANIQAGFVAGESAAAWLTSPCDGQIVAVQVAWLSLTGGTKQSIEDSITIFSNGTFPNPGAIKINTTNGLPAVLPSPLMTDGALNEFRAVDQQGAIPLRVNVAAGERFVVSFKFLNSPNPANGPSVITDIGGCQNQKNGLFAIPPSVWFNSCALFISGDFIIRAVINCPDTGACCVNGNCLANQTVNACASQGGTYLGNQTTCNANSCKGACCVPATQGCAQATQPLCQAGNGVFMGIGVTCASANCFAIGACCLGPGNCLESVTNLSCGQQGGSFQQGLLCRQSTCPAGEGACCTPSNSCLEPLTEDDCTLVFAGTFQGIGSTCGRTNCRRKPCPGDIAPPGGNQSINVDDLLLVINSWGACAGCPADVAPAGGNGFVNVDDLLFVINSWGPCR